MRLRHPEHPQPAQRRQRIVARNADGRLALFGTNSADNIWHRAQTSIGGAWNAWTQFDGALRSIAAETNADGRIEVFGVNAAGQIWHRSQV
ncbi:MAG TPA: tectonin domain-containing protein, partial [Microbacterium sp.]|nr:tectonin domain-containing protein [Microbacterium sp.]